MEKLIEKNGERYHYINGAAFLETPQGNTSINGVTMTYLEDCTEEEFEEVVAAWEAQS